MTGFAKKNTRIGFAQVERNHMAGGEIEGRIHAQLPVDTTTMGTVIENGRFAKYDLATGKVNLTGAGEWEMIYNEEMLYDERKQNHKDFAMKAADYVDSEIVPRLMAVEVGDIFTTNAIGEDTLTATQISAITDTTEAAITLPAVSDELYIAANGYLSATEATGPVFQVVKVYDLADQQPAVKVMRIQ